MCNKTSAQPYLDEYIYIYIFFLESPKCYKELEVWECKRVGLNIKQSRASPRLLLIRTSPRDDVHHRSWHLACLLTARISVVPDRLCWRSSAELGLLSALTAPRSGHGRLVSAVTCWENFPLTLRPCTVFCLRRVGHRVSFICPLSLYFATNRPCVWIPVPGV